MQLLERDPKNRLTAKLALEHKWFDTDFNHMESFMNINIDEQFQEEE